MFCGTFVIAHVMVLLPTDILGVDRCRGDTDTQHVARKLTGFDRYLSVQSIMQDIYRNIVQEHKTCIDGCSNVGTFGGWFVFGNTCNLRLFASVSRLASQSEG
ncbi:hypothetical protein TWF225_008207 [Orbilia oligospora]|uniref:Secreted protein n=1 Tax=Orbilia oligospora TaxID=2813651 RepID=A0A8H2HSL8_ORBOL|nr:hypothetical protein TWF225_008207 [Orbilia oligospora]KAF3246464.1 hypothetical protein TWF128_008924 [Orbilia oligospora]KAF3268924.1 hypothetical protein TWF217_010209 [Orbilia oligospora]TGJ67727.1 hypothetical protein EYR41_006839 [Orbilia oligospora]